MTNYDGFHHVVSDFSNLHYDGAGNLTQMTVTTPPLGQGQAANGTVTYTYDAQDRLTRELSQRDVTGGNGDLLGFDNLSASGSCR